MPNPYERSFKLLYSLLGMVVSGAKTIYWLNDGWQRMVNEPKPHEVFKIALEKYRAEVEFWEERFPEKGSAIVDIIGPFVSPALHLGLEPADGDLPQQATSAVFWYDQPREVVLEHVWMASRGPAEYEYPVSENFQTYLAVYQHSVSEDFRGIVALHQKLVGLLAERVLGRVKKALPEEFSADARKALEEELLRQIGWAILYLLKGYKDKNLQPLLGLWQTGRFPWIFRHHKLCVLCEGLAASAGK